VGQVRRSVDRAYKGCSWLGHPCPMRAVLSVLVLGAALALALPGVALGWGSSYAGDGAVRIYRESTDTTVQVSYILRCDYLGGDEVTSTYVPVGSSSSYARSFTQGVNQTRTDFVVVGRRDGGRIQAVFVVMSGSPYTTVYNVVFMGPDSGASVTVTGTVPVMVSNSPTVTLDTSVSIDGTLPVSVVSAGGFDESNLQLLLAACAVLGGAFVGVAFAQRSRAA